MSNEITLIQRIMDRGYSVTINQKTGLHKYKVTLIKNVSPLRDDHETDIQYEMKLNNGYTSITSNDLLVALQQCAEWIK